MGSDDLFEACSHPLRIEIIKVLARKPMRFTDIKRELKIDSSGLLDFHLKKLDDLITVDKEGSYVLTEKGFAALQLVETASKYGWQRRAFYLNLLVCILLNVYILLLDRIFLPITLPISVAWMSFYSYWTFVKRRLRLKLASKTNT
ncbi:MAG: helix-turn-helix domain-containing protein [Candidatus Bathyarchaeia archaeon]